MTKLEDIQKELQQMGDHFQRLQDSVAQLAQEQAQMKEAQAGENTEAIFTSAERKGAAYPLEGHVMGQVDLKGKEAYVSLLLFTWSLLQSEAKAADDGLVTVARIRESLHVDTPLYHLFCHMKETAGTELEMWFQKVDQSGGKSAYLLDTLILCQEMKAENDGSYGKLSQLYLLMGCEESMLNEATEAAGLIHKRNRNEYILYENHKWKSFDGKAGECYLNLVGDLNTPGQVAPTSYYALWPERLENATGVSKYAPKVMLRIEVAEGAIVEKGQPLFTIYGAKENVKRGLLSEHGWLSDDPSIKYDGSSDWGYIFIWKYNRKHINLGILDDTQYIKDDQKRLKECFLDNYETFSVKADRDGIVHWQSCVNKSPFWCIEQIADNNSSLGAYWDDSRKSLVHYGWRTDMIKKGRKSIDLRPGDVFVSSTSMTPSTIGEKTICVIEKM